MSWRVSNAEIRSTLLEAHLVFGVCSKLTDVTQTVFRSRLLLQHHELGLNRENLNELTSIGVLLTGRSHGYQDWDTTMMAITGSPRLSDEELTQFRSLWTPHLSNG